MEIVGKVNTQLNEINSYAIQNGGSSFSWSVTNGEIIGDSNLNVVLVKTLGINCTLICISNSISVSFIQNVCIPNIQGEIVEINNALLNQESFYEVVNLNGTTSTYFWEVENGLIVNGQNTSKIKVYWNHSSNTKVKVDVQNCNSLKLEKVVNVCIPVNLDITGSTNVNTTNIYEYSIINKAGTIPFSYTWNVIGGEITGNNNFDTVSVKWKAGVTHKVQLSCRNCLTQSVFKELEILLDSEISETPVLNNCEKCLIECNEITGILHPLVKVKLYNENNILIGVTNCDKRGYFSFSNVCDVKSIYITQTQNNKLESEKSNVLYLCDYCEETPKLYIQKC